jgi:hypothetical protein
MLFNGSGLTGRFEMIEDGEVIKVLMAELKPAKLDQREQIMAPNFVFHKMPPPKEHLNLGFVCNLELAEDERQKDKDHGIAENLTR